MIPTHDLLWSTCLPLIVDQVCRSDRNIHIRMSWMNDGPDGRQTRPSRRTLLAKDVCTQRTQEQTACSTRVCYWNWGGAAVVNECIVRQPVPAISDSLAYAAVSIAMTAFGIGTRATVSRSSVAWGTTVNGVTGHGIHVAK